MALTHILLLNYFRKVFHYLVKFISVVDPDPDLNWRLDPDPDLVSGSGSGLGCVSILMKKRFICTSTRERIPKMFICTRTYICMYSYVPYGLCMYSDEREREYPNCSYVPEHIYVHCTRMYPMGCVCILMKERFICTSTR